VLSAGFRAGEAKRHGGFDRGGRLALAARLLDIPVLDEQELVRGGFVPARRVGRRDFFAGN